MKIAIIRFPLESALGGEELHTLEVAKSLAAAGHEPVFVGDCPVLLDLFAQNDLETFNTKLAKPPVTAKLLLKFSLLFPYYWLKSLILTMELIAQKFDSYYLLGFAEKLLLPIHLPHSGLIFVEHARIDRWFYKNPWRHLYYFFIQRCQVITVSKLMQTSLTMDKKKPERYKIKVIPNGIDLKAFPAKTEPNFGKVKVQITTIGRLTEDKGMREFVEFIKLLKERGENIAATIIGNGPLRNELEAQIQATNLGDTVEIKSSLSQDQVHAALAKADLFCLFSTKIDPFGLVVAEAMSSGVNVLISDQCGIKDYSDLIKVFPANDLTKAVELYSEIKTKPLSPQQLHKEAVARFDAQKMLKAIQDSMRLL